ncbi:carboxylesterase/lipase family protein [Piscinibacter gummiphilus]|uniref:Carboxylic ester hydrolase n=1 Tax=Piscinibacter gummiphilus TaxID=946333 RepID=A0ABZ0CYL8_9BURK|nr:carboxylesterase family protein [Piscinibacter gummiphilus]WOB09995.1 carboxylesterase family protein [Piscinibacter gummiphilus]
MKMRTVWNAALRCIGVVAAAAAVGGCTSVPAGTSNLHRDTAWGPVVGTDDSAASGSWHWKGVPYARPPVGALRWRAPMNPERWSAPRAATAFAPACVQTGRLYGPGLNNRYDETIGSTLGKTLGSEDCLYLNIWTPASHPAAPRPVIVFVHGGSNITGYTADPVYDGAALARSQDVVVVSVNYRLGVFGFLDAAALKTGQREEDSGNFALLDIVKALEFVASNIQAFGGDASRVTLMGQSAGAVNVYALLSSPMLVERAKPLFHRVVALSGGISTAATLPKGAIPGVLPKAVWATRGEALLLESLVADGRAANEAAARTLAAERGAAEMAAWLRERSADAVLGVVRTRLSARGMAASNPIADGWVVAPDPIAAIRAGRYMRVPVLAGHTRDETKLFPQLFALRPDLGGTSGRLLDDAAVFALASRYDAEAAPQTSVEQWIPKAYLPASTPTTGYDARARELDRLWFSAIRDDVLDAVRSQQPQVWDYEFEWDELPTPFDTLFGAAHTFDLPFVFGNFGPSLYSRISFTRHNSAGRVALSKVMQRSLGAFARQGDPNDAALGTNWPQWPGRIVFDADASAARIEARGAPR